jgi:hypothetical protein
MALVREGTILTQQPPLDGEVSVNVCGWRVSRGQRNGSLWPYSWLPRPEQLLCLPSSCSIVLTGLSGPHSRPTTPIKKNNAHHSKHGTAIWLMHSTTTERTVVQGSLMPILSVSSTLINKAIINVIQHTAMSSLLKETIYMRISESEQHWCALCGLCT